MVEDVGGVGGAGGGCALVSEQVLDDLVARVLQQVRLVNLQPLNAHLPQTLRGKDLHFSEVEAVDEAEALEDWAVDVEGSGAVEVLQRDLL